MLDFRAGTTVHDFENYRMRLRENVLRAPLGLSLKDEDLSGEKDQLHFGLFDPEGTLTACAIAVPLSHGKVKIRQVAVASSRQRKGLGSVIMDMLEKRLAARGFQQIVLNARVSSADFYRKLGYTAISKEFIEITIPHITMCKTIQSEAAADAANH